MANPWEVMTAEELQNTIGIMFHAPKDADKVAYRWFAAASLAEMQFIMNGGDYTFRAQPVALDVGEMPDISGLYFTWENQEPETVAGFNEGVRDFSEFHYALQGTVERLDVAIRDFGSAVRGVTNRVERSDRS